jgi:MtrB/PioB family decaheme-associated outer membrane protein
MKANMKTQIAISVALLALPAVLPAQSSKTQTSGTVGVGGRATDNDTNSSKFTEYRDIRDQAFVPGLTFSAFNPGTRWFLDLSGTNVNLDHRMVEARAGKAGSFALSIDWTGVPHNFSNKARTPYTFASPGSLESSSNVPITFRTLATSAANTASVLEQDALIAAWQTGVLRPTTLATQTDAGRLAFEYKGHDHLRLGVTYDRRVKDGQRASFGPIGDRPPRSLNIQLTEPVDYATQDLTLMTEWVGADYQAQLSYTYSDFANAIDTFTWENVYATPDSPGASFQTWDRSVSTYGRRALSPDNQYHNATASFAANLPADSQLSATLAVGRLQQNAALVPYSFNNDRLANQTLPRATANAEITTRNLMVDYVVNPVSRLRLRAYLRSNGLDNDTPQSQWQYVTSDTSNLNGTVSYKNKRVNLAYAQDRLNTGAEATIRLRPWNSGLAFGFERDSVDREYREADTDENRITATFRARPASKVSLRARFLTSVRNGDYDPFVTRQSYWYAQSEVSGDQDNPAAFFSNHPDMVRYDVADRQRQQADVSLSLAPGDKYSLTASLRYRNDDFDSEVRSTQPLLGTLSAEASASTPGRQLGLLESKHLRYALDGFFAPTEKVSVNAFVSFDEGTSFQRSHEFNENNKGNPSAVATAELGPWTRGGNEWTADSVDSTWTAGLGANLQVTDRVTLSGSYTLSTGEVDITYGGFGVTNWDGTPYPPNHQFAFPTKPGLISQDMHMVDLRLEFPIAGKLKGVAGYGYEKYELSDWQQAPGGLPWVETVGSEFLLRDTSRSFQWGNRLFNLGTYLAPSFAAHVAWAAFNYRF